MKKVDRLIDKAKKKVGSVELTSAFIQKEGVEYKVRLDFIDHGRPRKEIRSCPSEAEANELINKTAENYPSGKKIVVFTGEEQL